MQKSLKGFGHMLVIFIVTVVLLILVFSSLKIGLKNNFDLQDSNNFTKNEANNESMPENLNTVQEREEPEEKYLREWDSYTSERFDFGFSNPGNFFLETTYEDYYSDRGHIHIYEMQYWELVTSSSQARSGPPLIGISVYENTDILSLPEWARKNRSHSNYEDSHVQTTIDGKKAIRYSWEGMGEGETVLVLDNNSGNVVSIGMFVTEDLIKPFEYILDSFKFTQ